MNGQKYNLFIIVKFNILNVLQKINETLNLRLKTDKNFCTWQKMISYPHTYDGWVLARDSGKIN